jgi:prepilin-type processing-associated H-X9-DG protein
MKESASKAVAISDAKQVALAALMYAADYDDVLPANLGGELLEPYLKNGSIFDGFVFVFGGGDLKKVADPASTVLGYKDGPGGRAVAYLDGHVVWEKAGG